MAEGARDDHDHSLTTEDIVDGWITIEEKHDPPKWETICEVHWPRISSEGDEITCKAGATSVTYHIDQLYDCGCEDMTWEIGAILVAAMFLGFVVGRRSLT